MRPMPDMAHLPDFTKDPDHPARIISGEETLTTKTDAFTIVVPEGATLNVKADLLVETLFVDEGGTLNLIPPTAKPLTITFRDTPVNTAFDGDQFGHGLLVLGRINSIGATKTPKVRVAVEPITGLKTITLATPVENWQVGDVIVFGDTRVFDTDDKMSWSAHFPRKLNDHTEIRTIVTVSADRLAVTLDSPLTYDHPAARGHDGTIRRMPWVSNHTRNIVWRSENPNGVRGHIMFTDRADVDVRFNQIDQCGRTRAELINSTTWNGTTPTHIGTNQVGRYALHLHRHIGPMGDMGRTLLGNVVNSPLRWGIAIHDTHWAVVKDNVVFGAIGAGIVTEQGQETECVIEDNLTVYTVGSDFVGDDDIVGSFGMDGDGFWASGGNNHWINNVAVDSRRHGFVLIDGVHSGQVLRGSKFPGADPMMPEEGFDLIPNRTELLQFDGFEAFGAIGTGASIYKLAKNKPPVTIHSFTALHCHESFVSSDCDSLILNDLMVIGGPPGVNTARIFGPHLDQNHDLTINGLYISGVQNGLHVLQPGYARLDGVMFLEVNGWGPDRLGEVYANVFGIAQSADNHNNSAAGTDAMGTCLLRNLTVDAPYQFYPNYFIQDGMNVPVKWTWRNENVNGLSGEVFGPEQDPNRQMPNTGTWTDPTTGNTWVNLKGAPVAGLTVKQSFEQFGLAYAGRVASCTKTGPWHGFFCVDGGSEHVLTVHASAIPTTLESGGQTSLMAVVTDSDSCPFTVRWSAPSGSFADPTALKTTWHAPTVPAGSQPLVVPITVTATCTDDGMTASQMLFVTVNPEEAPAVQHYTGVPTGTSVDGGVTITPNPPSEWHWTKV